MNDGVLPPTSFDHDGSSDIRASLPVLDSVQDYEKIFRIGEGTYGVVYKAKDRATGEIVALKKVRFDRSRDGVPVTSIREMRVLQACQHSNIVTLKRVVTGSKADSVFLVFEYCEHDLGRLLDWMPTKFSVPEVKCLLLQLLEAVAYLHSCWIMHRDLKMSNLLYTRNGVLKICDFGLARHFQPGPAPMTPRVVTLWYRPPEVMLGGEQYDESVDMWSVGCIMGELLRHEPLFPSQNELGCLRMMCSLLGSPSPRIWPGMEQLPGAAKLQFPEQPYNHIKNSFPDLSEAGCRLLNSLLTYDPMKRISAKEALRHEFFQEKPYPRHSSGMPVFPSSHERPADAPAPVAAKRPAPVDPVVEAKRQQRQQHVDKRFGEAFKTNSAPRR